MSYTVTLPIRKVIAVGAPEQKTKYVIYQREPNNTWVRASKYYDHSTNALAQLGRLTQRDTQGILDNLEGNK